MAKSQNGCLPVFVVQGGYWKPAGPVILVRECDGPLLRPDDLSAKQLAQVAAVVELLHFDQLAEKADLIHQWRTNHIPVILLARSYSFVTKEKLDAKQCGVPFSTLLKKVGAVYKLNARGYDAIELACGYLDDHDENLNGYVRFIHQSYARLCQAINDPELQRAMGAAMILHRQ